MTTHVGKLALYVYEYLLHVGAQKSAQTFLSEIRWEKNITLGEPPGFLHSWWCVFWDLYCAAPERRETCEHSSEAKAFHDYMIFLVRISPSALIGFKFDYYSPVLRRMERHWKQFREDLLG
ncbi:single-stranded DNA-binding protein 2-like isoform X2 [Rhincodon typus]|uniref:single-stranded DNA-binding protein 2-like isoform X2 n=1 Tax=Rhincodon typus TaxID=259920 RepID=UPI00202FF1C1|nr:single-stranded DNA-binding protein 2-like isoform X2 [Rhincodon typus]